MFANIATAITSSTAITLGLFYVMNMLITLQPGAIVDTPQHPSITFIRQRIKEDPPKTIERVPERKPTPLPPVIPAPGPETGPGVISVPRVPVQTPQPRMHGPNGAWTDGPLVSMVLAQPVYPVRAAQDGIEGFVIVEFDVGVDGMVSNVHIVESSHSLFEKSAINAVRKFRYKPRVVDGVPQGSFGIRNVIRYEMEH